jgi:hypothetical protein
MKKTVGDRRGAQGRCVRPLRRSEESDGLRNRRRRRPCCLSWGSPSFRVLYAPDRQGHRIPCDRCDPSPFLAEPVRFFSQAPSPVTLRSRVHPLVDFTPLQSTSASKPAPEPFGRSTSHGVRGFPLRGIGPECRHDGDPFPPSIRPRRFSRPRRFHPLETLQVYFTPQPRPGFSLQGFVPPAQPYRLVTGPSALSSLAPLDYRQLPIGSISRRPALRALLRAGIRDRRPGFTRTISPFPSWAFLLQVLRLRAAAKRVTVPRPPIALALAWRSACCRLGARQNSCESRRPARGSCLPSRSCPRDQRGPLCSSLRSTSTANR